MQWRLDKEGREYHHYEDFCRMYRSEILNLNRMLDTLMKNGMLPTNLQLPLSLSNVSHNPSFISISDKVNIAFIPVHHRQ